MKPTNDTIIGRPVKLRTKDDGKSIGIVVAVALAQDPTGRDYAFMMLIECPDGRLLTMAADALVVLPRRAPRSRKPVEAS